MKTNSTTLLLLIFIFFTSISSILHSQNLEWAKSYNGSNDNYGGYVTVDKLGNVYTTGTFKDSVDFDPGSNVFNLTSSGPYGNSDIYITKLNRRGDLIWAKQIGGKNVEFPTSLELDNKGNIYMCGIFEDSVDFDPGAGVYKLKNLDKRDIFVLKLDSSGNFIWAKQLSGLENENAMNLKVDSSYNIYLTGNFAGTVDFDPGPGNYPMTCSRNYDAFIAKLDSTGNFIWAKQFASSEIAGGISISLDSYNNIYTTGWFRGTTDFNPGSATYNLISSSPRQDIFISKLDSLGNFVWAKQIRGQQWEVARSITTDKRGNIYLTGDFQDTVDFDPDTGVYNLTSVSYYQNAFVLKLNSSGNFEWAKRFGCTDYFFNVSIVLDSIGNVYTSGYFLDTAYFDTGSSTISKISNGVQDIAISKLDSSGNLIWVINLGGSQNEYSGTLELDRFGNIYSTGSFSSTVDFDPSQRIFNLNSFGGTDVYVFKLNQSLITKTTEEYEDAGFFIYPNPTNGRFYLSNNYLFDIGEVEISILNMHGSILFSKTFMNQKDYLLNIEGSPGLYFIQINSIKGHSSFKLIKQ